MTRPATSGAAPLAVGIVCPYSFSHEGGVQNHVLGLAGWLTAQGHRVGVLGPGSPEPATLRPVGLSPQQVSSAGVGVPVAWNGSVARICGGPLAAARTRRWLAEGHFDVLHLHEPMTPSVSLWALGLGEPPVVATFHTATPGATAFRLGYRTFAPLTRRIDVGVAVSPVAAQVVRRTAGIDPRVVGNGIVAGPEPAPCTTRWRGGDHPRVAFVGRHAEPRKGLDVLLRALPAVRAVHPGLELWVVGRGGGRPVPGVRYLGPLDDDARNRVLATSDAYLAPQTGRESFGIVLLEALSCGAPVVASDLPAFREVASDEHGPLGELFTPGDPDALAAALLRSLARPRDELLHRGRERAAQFDWSRVGPEILAAYQDALRRRSSAGAGRPIA